MKKPQSHQLGYALLGYMTVITLILTWAPFRFAIPHEIELHFKVHLYDVVSNIFLFVPLGFLYQLSSREPRSQTALPVLIAGAALSGLIEIGQIFLPGRYTSPIDVMTNSAGAWLGGIAYIKIRSQMTEKHVGILTLNLPLMNLLYLLTPLFWLAGFTAEEESARIVTIPILALIGSIVLAAIYNYRLRHSTTITPIMAARAAVIWFYIASITIFMEAPMLVFLSGIFMGILVLAQTDNRRAARIVERRFEALTLRRVLPLFTLYLFLQVFWPFQVPEPVWDMTWHLDALAENPPLSAIFRFLEYLAAFTLFGYMISEFAGRLIDVSLRGMLWIFAFVISFAAELEFIRGLHPDYPLSVAHFVMGGAAGVFGAIIYYVQLSTIRSIIATRRKSTAENHFANQPMSTRA